MSNQKIRAALEKHLKLISGDIKTAWENVNFAPEVGVPYQSVNTLFAEPDNRGWGDGPYIQRGIFQVGEHFPPNAGPVPAATKAEAVREHFKRGTTIDAGGFNVIVERTPEISTSPEQEDGRYVQRVRIRFFAHIERNG